MMSKALLVIDLQNDYFPEGAFPLWNAELTLAAIETAIVKAQTQQIPVIIIQHIANPVQGIAPFFNANTVGAQVHPRILAAAPHAPIIIKHFADSFEQTELENTLQPLGITELLICGMMTQNCVTHTAISKAAEKYKVTILPDCCTTVSEILHLIALHAVSTRVELIPSEQALV
ncbi:MAG: isochorismatase family protein [Thiofilum sp.]|uniref:cysteine hydrolase family protein n=1 Tax=Thiofilum sp. TaxID=2212733 RepID=UPI0025FCF2D2|nr:isochorismatase family protein [Thiofilum sp.]MBK8454437.1 isochorismatase family protein [Thiofilum sp.]